MTALHGFLGRPQDWDGVMPPGSEALSWSQVGGLWALAADLNAQSGGGDLVGYSMGGRIALHMILQAPGQWRRAVIISASPGLSDPAERAQRVESDRRWAHRFRHDPWDELLAAWNAQSVFTADPPDNTPRAETDYDRELLATALELGSVGLQEDLRDQLRAADCQILWLAGAKDPKYAALAEECAALNPRFRAQIIPDAGHRVLWGNPNALRAALNDFLAE